MGITMNRQMKKQKAKSIIVMTVVMTVLLLSALLAEDAKAEWSIDLSRRTQQLRKKELTREPATVRAYDDLSGADTTAPTVKTDIVEESAPKQEGGFFDKVFEAGEPSQDIVILSTERGFVPNTIRVRKDGRYNVYVVNVNEKEKNVSFILDGFSENHATFFGKVKQFRLEPKKEGVYSFLSPETAMEGKFIVYSPGPAAPPVRQPSQATAPVVDSNSGTILVGGNGR